MFMEELGKIVAALPPNFRPGPDSCLTEFLVIGANVMFVICLLFLWRSFRSIQSRLYVDCIKNLRLKKHLYSQKMRSLKGRSKNFSINLKTELY